MLEKYQIPKQFNVEVKTTFKGERIGKSFLDENPSIADLYPDQSEVNIKYLELKNETSKNMYSILEITEKGVIKHIDIKPL